MPILYGLPVRTYSSMPSKARRNYCSMIGLRTCATHNVDGVSIFGSQSRYAYTPTSANINKQNILNQNASLSTS